MASSGASGQWRALPFPVRLAGLFLAGMVMIWLTRWLGGISVLVALLLWCAVGIGLAHASGWFGWVDRYPWVARLLEGFAPHLATGAPAAGLATTHDPAVSRPGKARARPPPPSPAASAPITIGLSDLVGLDSVIANIDELVATRAGRISPVAPATLVLLVGPRGTGKSSVALALVAKLHLAGARKTDRIVAISPTELHGLDGGYGPSDDVLKAVGDHIQAALDGTLLIDDLDWLTAAAGGQAAAALGSLLLATARRYPGRLFVIGTGSAAAIGRLDPTNRWLGQFDVRRIDFPPLGTAALQDIFQRLLKAKGLRLADGTERAVQIQIEERRSQGGDDFDNAHAIRRLVDDVLYCHGLRMLGADATAAPIPSIVTAEDVRNARPSL